MRHPIFRMNKRYLKWSSYFVACLAVGVALETRYLLIDSTNEDTTFVAAVAVTALFGGFWPGLLAVVLSMAITLSDYPILYHDSQHPYWTMGFFAAEGVLVSFVCQMLHRSRRRARDSALEADTLRDRIISISEAEQRRIGQDLHDGLGQQLTGIAFLSQSLATRLGKRKVPEVEEAQRIVAMVSQTIGWTRDLARGLTPVAMEADDLVLALRQLAQSASGVFQIRCEFIASEQTFALPPETAIHLYRIAQEALSNAIKHAEAGDVRIELRNGGKIELLIRDNGKGIELPAGASNGLGLEIMRHRARLIGATLLVRKAEGGGTLVQCRIPPADQGKRS